MRRQDPRVPVEVEEYLVGLNAAAGEFGGRIGGSVGAGVVGAASAGGSRGARGGARGGAFGARMLKTVVEERSGEVAGGRADVVDRFRTAVAEAGELVRKPDLVRFTVTWGRTGLQQVVVDLGFLGALDGPECEVRLRAYCKEGLINRSPTARTADRAWAAISEDPPERRL